MRSTLRAIWAFLRRLYATYHGFQKDDALQLAAATTYYITVDDAPWLSVE